MLVRTSPAPEPPIHSGAGASMEGVAKATELGLRVHLSSEFFDFRNQNFTLYRCQPVLGYPLADQISLACREARMKRINVLSGLATPGGNSGYQTFAFNPRSVSIGVGGSWRCDLHARADAFGLRFDRLQFSAARPVLVRQEIFGR
jgi:hypothetical protein